MPSATTYTVKKLEEQLNVKLFDRNKQRAILTPAGKLILEKGRTILHDVQQLEEQVQLADSGWEKRLRIVIDTILPCEPFWPLIKELQIQQPWLDIQVIDEALSGSWEALVNDRADLVIGVGGDEPAGGHWQKECIGNLSVILCCSPNHPASQLTVPVESSQLKGFTHIVVSDSARHLAQRSVGLLGVQQVLAVSHMTQKCSALINGMGISHLPTHIANPLIQSGQLVPLHTHSSTVPHPFFMCWKKQESGKANEWLRTQIQDRQILTQYMDQSSNH